MSSSIQKLNFTTLEEELNELPPKHRLFFAVSVCERLIPRYYAFATELEWGNPDVYRLALDRIWDFLTGKELSDGEVQELIESCKVWIPNTRHYDPVLSSSALDAAICVMETLECCLDPSPERAARIGNLARYSISVSIQQQQFADDPDSATAEKIIRNPLMVGELRKQNNDLRMLKGLCGKEIDSRFLVTFRRSLGRIKSGQVVRKPGCGKLTGGPWKFTK